MRVLSKATVYGLRALVYIALKKDRTSYVSIGEISEALDISFHFLTKTFQSLTQHNILESYRGPNGGIAFAKPPEEIYLVDVVNILEGKDFFNTCLLGLPGCGEATPCPLHEFWKATKDVMKREFETTSLAHLGARVSEDRLRISG